MARNFTPNRRDRKFNKYENDTFAHIFDRSERIIVTRPPERKSKDNPNPETLAFGRYEGEPAGVVRPFLDEELVPLSQTT